MTLLRYFILTASVLLPLLLGACGQKGDLYLPPIPEAPEVLSRQSGSTADAGRQEDASKRSGRSEPKQDESADKP